MYPSVVKLHQTTPILHVKMKKKNISTSKHFQHPIRKSEAKWRQNRYPPTNIFISIMTGICPDW